MRERDVGVSVRQRLATRVRILRAQHRWNQETLADRAGLHRTTIGQIERGTLNIGVASLARLAQAFAVPLGALVDEPSVCATGPSLPDGPYRVKTPWLEESP